MIYSTCFAPLHYTTSYVHPNCYDVLNMDKDVGLLYKVQEDGRDENGYSRGSVDVDEEVRSDEERSDELTTLELERNPRAIELPYKTRLLHNYHNHPHP